MRMRKKEERRSDDDDSNNNSELDEALHVQQRYDHTRTLQGYRILEHGMVHSPSLNLSHLVLAQTKALTLPHHSPPNSPPAPNHLS